jgi:hypothetical protein
MKSVLKALFNAKFAIAAVAVAAQGCQNDGVGSDGLDVSGRWAMFSFEDPVAVDIHQAGGAIDGRGCCDGLSGDRALACCGIVTGEIVDRRASFGFTPGLGPEVYSTAAVVSSDGKRMAGAFSRMSVPVAWVRIGSQDAHLPPPEPALESIIGMRTGVYALVLSDGPAAGIDFSPQHTYALYVVGSGFLFGHLGAFWSGEMAWNADQQMLVVGPVPETAPGLPVAMSLRFDGTALASVEAVMASGARYQFQATPSQP